MNLTIKELQDLAHFVFSLNPPPRKIKITSSLNTLLNTVCKPVFKEMSPDEFVKTYGGTGTVGQFEYIPIEIDDTIENEYYELVYKEN